MLITLSYVYATCDVNAVIEKACFFAMRHKFKPLHVLAVSGVSF
jgi:hypothetical protein